MGDEKFGWGRHFELGTLIQTGPVPVEGLEDGFYGRQVFGWSTAVGWVGFYNVLE